MLTKKDKGIDIFVATLHGIKGNNYFLLTSVSRHLVGLIIFIKFVKLIFSALPLLNNKATFHLDLSLCLS